MHELHHQEPPPTPAWQVWRYCREATDQWRDRWAMLLAWRSNARQIRHCIARLDDAGIFAVSPDSQTLCTHIALFRQRPLHLVSYPFVRDISGIVLSDHDADWIYFAET